MITIDTLTVRAGGRTILDRLTMHLSEGRIHGIAGINGAGKTTLLNTLYGFMPAASGSITRNGRPLRRRETAYLESENFFYSGMTGRDYLDLIRHYHPSADPTPYVKLFALPIDEEVTRWSTGMKKKLALTAALMQEKEVLLLDEPFNGLDMEAVYAAQRMIAAAGRAGRTVLVTSHIFPTLEAVADDLFVIDGGSIAGRYDRPEFPRAARELEVFFRRRYEAAFAEK